MSLDQINVAALAKWMLAFGVAQWLTIPGGTRQAFTTLFLFMAMDIITGLWVGALNRKIDSGIGFRGISKKVGICCFLLFAHSIERACGIEMNIEFAGALGYTINEAISIIENFALIGVPIPAQLVTALVQVQKLKPSAATDEQLRQLLEKQGEAEQE